MDRLSKIEQELKEHGNELVDHITSDLMSYVTYKTKHHNIVSIYFSISSDTDIVLGIYVEPSSILVYINKGYHMSSSLTAYEWGTKNFQSSEDLLNELHDLELINCGHNIKGM